MPAVFPHYKVVSGSVIFHIIHVHHIGKYKRFYSLKTSNAVFKMVSVKQSAIILVYAFILISIYQKGIHLLMFFVLKYFEKCNL
jgi:hypothetical protein